MLLFAEKVKVNTSQFTEAVKKLASKYAINPNWLMALFNSETGGSFSPSQRNGAGSGATGLIQFMPATAASLGTSTAHLATLSNVAQLAWVDKYIAYTMKYLGVKKIKDYDDLYLLIFYPKAVGKPDSYVIAKANTSTYAQNKGIDLKGNSDGILTVSDFKKFIRTYIPASEIWQFSGRNRYRVFVYIGLTILLICLGFFFRRFLADIAKKVF